MDSAGFLLRYPEFKSVEQIALDAFVKDAAGELEAVRWGKLFERGAYALAAHMLSVSGYSGDGNAVASSAPAQAVQSETAGQLSVSYAQAAPANNEEAFFMSTRYGQEFMRLRNLVPIVGFMVTR